VVLIVVAKPGWLDNADSTITFDPNTYLYDIHFHRVMVDKEGTLDQMLNTSIPLIGDKANQLLVEVDSQTTASLDPNSPVEAPLTAHAKLELLGATTFDEQWDGSAQPTDHFSINTSVQIDPATLDATILTVTFRLTKLQLVHFASPDIPLFAYGIPGVADIEADRQFLFDASFSAAVTLGVDAKDPSNLGLASATFVGLTPRPGVKLSGNIKILGLDVASLSGTVTGSVAVDYGLTTRHDQLVPLGDFGNDSAVGVHLDLDASLEADVLGIKVGATTLGL
jgi:hypothetical protein